MRQLDLGVESIVYALLRVRVRMKEATKPGMCQCLSAVESFIAHRLFCLIDSGVIIMRTTP